MTEPSEKRAFIAGATGFTGQALAHQPRGTSGVALTLQVRPGSSSRSVLGDDDRVREVGIDDADALTEAVRGHDAVVQLIGTVRAKFDATTSYETVDYGTTVALLSAAARARVPHFVLLSSVGAGVGAGSYLSWKKKTERVVIDHALPASILRPSILCGDDELTARPAYESLQALFTGLSDTPLGTPFYFLRPINIQLLARLILDVVAQGPPASGTRIVEGPQLFSRARALGLLPGSFAG